jgi:NAD-dependent deacetylase
MSLGTLNIKDYKRVVFFTGAGMSAESGVPTYRGAGGIWKEYDWRAYACQEAFERDPVKVWEFHNYRRKLIGACAPNRGHELIAAAEKTHPHVAVVTQNIDGLHQRAGSKSVEELHGSLWRVRCHQCSTRRDEPGIPVEDIRCACGRAYLRPDIVWFGDSLFPHVIDSVMEELEKCELLISIGTSAVVYPAAEMPLVAKRAGATLVEINPEETPLSELFDIRLRGTATQMLPQLCAAH